MPKTFTKGTSLVVMKCPKCERMYEGDYKTAMKLVRMHGKVTHGMETKFCITSHIPKKEVNNHYMSNMNDYLYKSY